jgi:hypothetical protein
VELGSLAVLRTVYGNQVIDEHPVPPSPGRARPRRKEKPELAQPTSMRRHASSHFPVLPRIIMAQMALAEHEWAPWACGLKLWECPNTPCASVHVGEPMIVFPRQSHSTRFARFCPRPH